MEVHNEACVFALVGLAALTGTAAAADLPPRPAPAPYYKAPVAFRSTTGPASTSASTAAAASAVRSGIRPSSFDTSGGLVGGTVGYNYQFGQAVFGVEGDIDWADINGTTNTVCPFGCKTSDHWLSTVRGRLGYAADRFMPFVTGGAAFGDIRASTPGFAGGNHHQCRLDRRWRPRIRHRRELDRQGRISLRRPRQVQLRHLLRRPVTDNVSFTTNLVRAGVNYRF